MNVNFSHPATKIMFYLCGQIYNMVVLEDYLDIIETVLKMHFWEVRARGPSAQPEAEAREGPSPLSCPGHCYSHSPGVTCPQSSSWAFLKNPKNWWGESFRGCWCYIFFFNWLIFRTRGAPEGLKTKFVKMSTDRLLSLSLFFSDSSF